MNKVVALIVVAALGFGLWKFWPQIAGMVGGNSDDDKSGQAQGPPAPNADSRPDGTSEKDGNDDVPTQSATPTPRQPAPPEEVVMELQLNATPDADNALLKYVLTYSSELPPSALDDAVFQYRAATFGETASWEKMSDRVGEQQFAFRSDRDIRFESVVEIKFDPADQTPAVRKLIGENGARLRGDFTREEGGKTILHAVTRFRPDMLQFTAQESYLKKLPLTRGG